RPAGRRFQDDARPLSDGGGDYTAARETLRQALALNPKSSFATAYLGANELLDGKPDAAFAVFKATGDDIWGTFGMAVVQHTLGHPKEAQDALDKLIRDYASGSAYQIADVYVWRGETDKAFEWLDRAFDQHYG